MTNPLPGLFAIGRVTEATEELETAVLLFGRDASVYISIFVGPVSKRIRAFMESPEPLVYIT